MQFYALANFRATRLDQNSFGLQNRDIVQIIPGNLWIFFVVSSHALPAVDLKWPEADGFSHLEWTQIK